MIYKAIKRLVQYGIITQLITEEDISYITNQLLDILKLEDYEDYEIDKVCIEDLEDILAELLDYAYETGLIPDNTTVYRDLFDTRLMGVLVDRPSVIREQFQRKYKESAIEATDYYYNLSMNSDYIRRYRVRKDLKWKAKTKYGEIDITINLSKPEKDPKAIAAAKHAKQTGYPTCLLCKENEGYAGRINHPARNNHRIIPVTLNNREWYLQYSPYVYYNEHCIVFQSEHEPMVIDKNCFTALLDFVEQFPHYLIGSNADLPIVGGSILTHEHFQGGNYHFAMQSAPIEIPFSINRFEGVAAGIVKWPMSVIRLSSHNPQSIIEASDYILRQWREYSDEECGIYARTEDTPHNTITPIAYKSGDTYIMDLVLRNNRTTEEHPLGVFHPHSNLHHIKKENIGLIEVMGLAVLPSRLKQEMEVLGTAIIERENIASIPEIAKHADWVKEFLPKYTSVREDNIQSILQIEIGNVFTKVLEDAAVYKRDKEGIKGFIRFVESFN